MKSFVNLQEALNYHQYCPFCSSILNVSSPSMVEDYCPTSTHKLSLYVYDGSNDYLTINSLNNEIRFQYSEPGPTPERSGIMVRGVRASCDNCCLFYYSVQLWINLDEQVVYDIMLNTESVTVANGEDVYEIANIYPTEQTQYIHHSSEETKKVDLPLIQMDINNPNKTLQRVRKLITFS